MGKELRKAQRFVEIGRVDAPDFCLFSGVLIDISLTGCKVKFPTNLEIDCECEYELKVHCARKEFSEPFSLIANVSWFKNSDSACEVGFNIIRSPSTREFEKLIKSLEEEKLALDEENALLENLKNN